MFILSFILSSFCVEKLRKRNKSNCEEEKAIKNLVNSVIEKVPIVENIETTKKLNILNSSSKELKIIKIFNVACGGQFEKLQIENKIIKLANAVKRVVEKTLTNIKKQKLKNSYTQILYKNAGSMLEIFLNQLKIKNFYSFIGNEINSQIIVVSMVSVTSLVIALSWVLAGFSVIIGPSELLFLVVKIIREQLLSRLEFIKYKKLINNIKSLKESINGHRHGLKRKVGSKIRLRMRNKITPSSNFLLSF